MSDTEYDLKRTKVGFDPKIHKEIMFRSILIGLPKDVVAAVIGITPLQLDHWIAEHPELREAVTEANQADANVAMSLYYAAIGLHPQSRKAVPPSVLAQKLWLQQRQQWFREEKGRGPGGKALEDMTVADLAGLVRELMEKVSRPALSAPSSSRDPVPFEIDHDPGF